MRAVIQRVQNASVTISGETVSAIGRGLCVLIGIHKTDVASDIEYIVRKILNIRIFEDERGKRWQRSVKDLDLEVLCVSQFTLYCDLKGNKPDYRHNMGGEAVKAFYDDFMLVMKKEYKSDHIKDGVFGAMMKVELVNDGPVTITLDSPKKNVYEVINNE